MENLGRLIQIEEILFSYYYYCYLTLGSTFSIYSYSHLDCLKWRQTITLIVTRWRR